MGRITENCTRCCLWRGDILILVCVGASEYKMDRLLTIIDELCDEQILDGKQIVAQIGSTSYSPRNFKSFKLIGRDEFQTYIEQADLVITHAGTGSVIPPLKLGKKVIVFPRLKKYKEHLDDHQLELRDVFTNSGYTLSAENKEELLEALSSVPSFIPKTFVSNNKKINDMVIDFIERS
ncbi:capsular biosynthesis protein CpsG [Clostridium sp. MCC353]|uniref:PssE/Cps14G family polysaccharide biosynthesis glycosyltransferase n=1 Tax=Clostridium sp. MCC353 TaxID=2592646 RepID=UPI0023DF75DA|nr:PssE/Cps14G family polysaccharide biosynthesis glycosyltransferase [Clostridium sp. MCC353]MBT9777077.1 capsular biosynthesis protein CpsG [Clostridium sp. MCC353]